VVGAIGQPWRLSGGRGSAVAGGEDFAAFDQAGYAKLAASFRLAPRADGRAIQLSTETRVACTDPSSARRFARYWQLIRPASGRSVAAGLWRSSAAPNDTPTVTPTTSRCWQRATLRQQARPSSRPDLATKEALHRPKAADVVEGLPRVRGA
jgi:non-ribosomal peptide synthetase component F